MSIEKHLQELETIALSLKNNQSDEGSVKETIFNNMQKIASKTPSGDFDQLAIDVITVFSDEFSETQEVASILEQFIVKVREVSHGNLGF